VLIQRTRSSNPIVDLARSGPSDGTQRIETTAPAAPTPDTPVATSDPIPLKRKRGRPTKADVAARLREQTAPATPTTPAPKPIIRRIAEETPSAATLAAPEPSTPGAQPRIESKERWKAALERLQALAKAASFEADVIRVALEAKAIPQIRRLSATAYQLEAEVNSLAACVGVSRPSPK